MVYLFDYLCSRESEPAVELPSHLLKELGDPTGYPAVRSAQTTAYAESLGRQSHEDLHHRVRDTSAMEFFMLLMKEGVQKLPDIRRCNQSQLAGFTKGRDLQNSANCRLQR